MQASPYAVGFRSLDAEVEIDRLPVTGSLPEWLSGRLLRTGPAKFEVGDRSYNHWFDGLAMLHAFGFEQGQVSYANRFLESRSKRQAQEHGEIYRAEFATDPCRSIFGRVMSVFSPKITDNANVNIVRLGEHYLSLTETPMPIEFDPQTLETVGELAFPTDIAIDTTTAHPHLDATSGKAINHTAKYGRTSSYRMVATDPKTLEREIIGRVETDRPAYMHSFGMSESYVVLVEFPFVVNPLRLLASGKPFIENFRWEPSRGTRFHVIRKSDGEVVGRFEAEARFAFHHVNAFEQGDEVVVDIATYPDASVIDELYLDRLRSAAPVDAAGRLERFRLDLNRSRVESEFLSDTMLELPRLDYRRVNTRPYRHVWGVGVAERGNFIDQIVHFDLDSGETSTWREAGCYPGEAVFVGRPGAGDTDGEPDGVLLSVVLDAEAERSFLLVLDATTLEERARARVPHHIPFQFHGSFYR